MRKYPPPPLFVLLFVLIFSSVKVFSQTRSLTGVVKDSSSQPLVAATVTVKGTKTSTVTAADGSFTLTVPSGNITLEVNYVGYNPVSVPVGPDQADVTITMQAGANTISDVVVTALGIKKEERKLGYAISTVNGNSLNKARETNVALSLAGQVAGLDVHGTSGGPGGTARILLRGMPSMNSGGSPLFVINGVPMDNSNRGSAGEWGGADAGDGISNINPDDIETMTVLKGQAASALYGARASNGVILITTKSGKKGAASVEYNTNFQADAPMDLTDYQYVYGQGTGGDKPTTTAAALSTTRLSWGALLDGSSVIGYDGNTYSYSAVSHKTNMNNFYRTGSTFTNTVAVSGGGDNGTYRISASNMDNKSILLNSGIQRKTFNLNLNQNVTKKLNVNAILTYLDQSDRNRPYLSDGPLNPNNFWFLANSVNDKIFKPGYDSTGAEIVFSDDSYATNPWFVVNKVINNQSRDRIISSLSAKYNFTGWLYAMARLGYDNENDRYKTVTPSGTAYAYNTDGQSGYLNNLSKAQTSEINVDGIIGVNHNITKDISLNATLGANLRKNRFETVGVSGSYFVIDGLYTPTNVVSYARSYDFSAKEVHSAYYAVDLGYKNFLTLSTTGRYDAFSTLYNSSIPSNKRNIFTPSVTGSFIFSELLHSSVLNFGKLRLSYAQTSGEPSDAYQTAVYYYVNNTINGTPSGGFSSSLPNLFLKPFVKTESEIGTELKFLHSRLGLDVSYYFQKTKHEIMDGDLSAATGYTSRVIANGSVQNKGLEVQVTGTPVQNRNFNWDVTFNLSNVKNKILKTDADNNDVTLGTYRPLNANTAFVVGKSGPQILAYDYTYYDDKKTEIEVDEDGLPIQGSLTPMGSVLPTLYGGLNNSFTYKKINLSFLIDYNYGNYILSASKYYAIYRGLDKMTLKGRESGITTGVYTDGTTNTVAADAEDYYQRLATVSKVNVLDGDYIKLRQVTLGYTFGGDKMKMPVFSAIQVSLVARNLAILMKKSGDIDPEAGFNASVSYAGIEGTSLPSTRTFGINVNFKFKN
ncbi:SusC/RagA family TonB-linked outer membrane protein [Parafilimonas sp.]|uniref:SusC/RagA family TonB-linked outer membrane protein n=1 Tax=Parafilimonas sp. TaxID=1969739 RepID=UPI0039E497EE